MDIKKVRAETVNERAKELTGRLMDFLEVDGGTSSLEEIAKVEMELATLYEIKCRYILAVTAELWGEERTLAFMESLMDFLKSKIGYLRNMKASDALVSEALEKLTQVADAFDKAKETEVDLS